MEWQLEGRIEIQDSSILNLTSDVGISDFKNILGLSFIQTGSGGGRNKFRYYGMIWLYDFPKMHELEDKIDFRVLNINYMETLDNYNKKFTKDRDKYVGSNSEIQRILLYTDQLITMQKELSAGHTKTVEHLTNIYNSENGVPLPVPPNHYGDSEKIMKIQSSLNYHAVAPAPEHKSLFNRLRMLVN